MMNLNYDIWLVLLSLLQCSLAMFVTFSFVKRIYLSSEASKQLLLPIYSIAVGSGIWGIHVVNFLAFENGNTLQFSTPLMLASWLFGWLVGFILCRAACKKYVSLPQLVFSGVVAGICGYAMFYLLTIAVYTSSQITFDYVQLLVSLTLVTVLSLLTIVTLSWMKAYVGKNALLIKSLLSLITGAAIIGLHLVFSTSITLHTDTLMQVSSIATDKKNAGSSYFTFYHLYIFTCFYCRYVLRKTRQSTF
jgi:two-component system, sensor histidine kinase and response regulator